ncbi:hypothetical protein FACS1894152_4070 [Bacilli bacterium]|nr:hypothetical protein FACS1894152_4070 [Bacilli bacterium]
MAKNELLDFIIEQLDNYKVENIETIDIHEKTSLADYLVVGTGRGEKHIESIAEELKLTLKERGVATKASEGRNSGWVALDLGDILLHLFTERVRNTYKLEQLWIKEIK